MHHDTPKMSSCPTIRGLGTQGQTVPRRGLYAEILVLPLDGRVTGFKARCRDITHRGVFIPSTRTLSVDSLVVLKISIAKLRLLELTAQVIHTVPGHGFGCLFLDLGRNAKQTLSLLVAACSAAPPSIRTIPPDVVRRRESSRVLTRPRWRTPRECSQLSG